MALAVYGKHPAKGDFLEYGVPEALKPGLEAWLDAVLAEARAVLAAEWDRVWLNAPMLRFWIGDGIWGAPVAGVMAASQDRVGRRFPLVLLALGGVPPPVIDPDQGWYDAACLHLAGQLARVDLGVPELGVPDLGVAAALLSGAPVPAGGYGLFQPPEPGAALMPDLPELPAALLPVPEPRPLWSQVWAGPGLPSGAVLAWFFRGYAGEV